MEDPALNALADARKKFAPTTAANAANGANTPAVISGISVSSSTRKVWPYTRTENEPRCPTCRYWWQKATVWLPTHEVLGDCLLHGFEILEKDNCKVHEPQQCSGLVGTRYEQATFSRQESSGSKTSMLSHRD